MNNKQKGVPKMEIHVPMPKNEPQADVIDAFVALTYDQKVEAMRHIKKDFAASTEEQMKTAETRNCFLKEVRDEFFANR